MSLCAFLPDGSSFHSMAVFGHMGVRADWSSNVKGLQRTSLNPDTVINLIATMICNQQLLNMHIKSLLIAHLGNI